VLTRLGWRIVERPFEYSQFPGRVGTPLGGAALAATITVAGAIARRGDARAAFLLLAAALLAGGAVAAWTAKHGLFALGVMRARGVNLECVRGSEPPRVWLVAHVDSKWQPISILARASGIVGLSLVAGVAVAVSIAAWSGRSAANVWPVLIGLAWLSSLPVMLSFVGARGPGAADNASGVAAVLVAAELIPPDAAVGILITDAEELGLAGAHAWARGRGRGTALNCDTIDDAGVLTEMYSGHRARRAGEALARAATTAGEPVRVMRLVPGVLTDSVALADAGWHTLTLSRGTLRTLAKIHTTADSLDNLRGDGIDTAARVLAAAAMELAS
jgi:hypothetical protein